MTESDPVRLRLWNTDSSDSLLAAMHDPDSRTRAVAVLRLGETGGDSVAVVALAGMLGDPSCGVRRAAVYVLGGFPFRSPVAMDAVAAAAPLDPCIRYEAFRSIARDGLDALTPFLAGTAPDSVRLDAYRAGAITLGTVMLPLLRPLLADPDPRFRGLAISLVSGFGPGAAPAAGDLLAALRLEAEGDGGNASATPEAYDQARRARSAEPSPASALAAIGSAALPVIEEGLSDGSDWVRRESARAAGEVGEAAAPLLPTILRRFAAGMGDPYPAAVQRIGPAAVPDLLALLDPSQPAELRCGVLGIVGSFGPRAEVAMPLVRRSWADPDPWVQAQALLAWHGIDPPGALQVCLGEARPDSLPPPVRSALFKVLERNGAGAAAALPMLIRIVGEPASPARSEAEIVLNAMGPAAAPAVTALRRGLTDPTLDLDAVEALGHIGPAAAEIAPLLAARIDGELAREDSTWSVWMEEARRRDREPASSAPPAPGGITWARREPGPYFERRIPSLACAEALVSIDPQRGNEALGRLLERGIPPARTMALQRVAKLGRAAEPLRERVTRLLADRGESASMAASALGRMGSAGCPAAGALARAVRDSTTAEAALGALGTLASACPEAVEALSRLLDDRTTPRRADVARAMANGLKLSDAAGRRLEAALRDPDPVVRAAAAWVLGKRDE